MRQKSNKNLEERQSKADLDIIRLSEEVLAEVIGAEKAKYIKPLFLKNRTLTITCLGNEAAQVIRGNQQAILTKINEKLGKKDVDRLRYLL